MSNYWYYANGHNTLSGSTLTDDQIVEFLLTSRKSREDFQEAYDSLVSDTDKQRITLILQNNPKVVNNMIQDEKIALDTFQRKWNRAGIFLPKK